MPSLCLGDNAGQLISRPDSFLLPAPQVTHLVVQRPRSFRFRPGDYVYLNVPAIAAYEWHPFTISSAPEQRGGPRGAQSPVGVLVWHRGDVLRPPAGW